MKIGSLIFIMMMLSSSTAFAKLDTSKLIKVDAKTKQNCVEYYTFQGALYCSETMLSSENHELVNTEHERQVIQFDTRPWLASWSKVTDRVVTYEYIPMGDSISSWSELVTSQFYPGLQNHITPQAFMTSQMAHLKEAGYQPIVSEIKKTSDMVLFEFRIVSPKEQAQDELQKIVKAKNGIYVLHYVIRKQDMGEENRKQWVNNLLNSTFK